jgi:hypothetical protein
MLACPCGGGRVGAFLFVCCLYYLSLTGVPHMVAQVQHGAPEGIGWMAIIGLGIACIFIGVASALSHEDAFRADSFCWSVFVVALCSYALLHDWVPKDGVHNDHIVYGWWLAWGASNAFNIWLQLRGILSRRQPLPVMQTAQQPELRHRRRMTTEWLEEVEGRGIDAGFVLPASRSATPLPGYAGPGVIEHAGAAPQQLVYVKQGDALVPVLLPDTQMQRRMR